MEAEILNLQIDSGFYDALNELFKRGRVEEHYSNDYHAIENLCLFLRLILDNLEKMSLLLWLFPTNYVALGSSQSSTLQNKPQSLEGRGVS